MKFCKIIKLTYDVGFVYATENKMPISVLFRTYADAYRAAAEAGYFVID